jgi:excinuclease ABC subunit C
MNPRLPYLREKTAKLTTSPGVYRMKNQAGTIIYIGKAKNLKNRVTSYFRVSADHTPKVAGMVEAVYDYDFIVTDTEYEALVLECSLIKQHQPKYNILLKDDKGYHYIRVSDEAFPRFSTEQNKGKPGTYLGPYMSGFVAKETVREVNRVFQLPTCQKGFPAAFHKGRPCLQYHIKQCMGLCQGGISKEAYQATIQQAIAYIRNGSADSVKRMQQEMEEAAAKLDFERAAVLRDRIAAISKAGETQKILDSDIKEADVLAVCESNGKQCVSVLLYRNRRLFDQQTYFFQQTETETDLLESFIGQYYSQQREVPRWILLPVPLEQQENLRKMLVTQCGHAVTLSVPQRGTAAQVLQLSKQNAAEALALQMGRTAKEVQALEELKQALALKTTPAWIEAYDISNLADTAMVAGMVVFQNGKPYRKAYKRFSLESMTGQDDYACMRQVLHRRLLHLVEQTGEEGFSRKPDLILLDGGQGHVHVVQAELAALHLEIPLYGMVKDQKHRTRAIAGNGGEITLSRTSAAFQLLTQIQDEVHRFAITYMRSHHKKTSYTLELTQVKGIGEKKAQQLLVHFKTKENLKAASPEMLARVAGVSHAVSMELYAFLQNM